jgi:hypothetical protein
MAKPLLLIIFEIEKDNQRKTHIFDNRISKP